MKKDEAAFPIVGEEFGLTKREYFAGLAMQGMLANSEIFKMFKDHTTACDLLSLAAVEQSDSLIAELNKPIV